MLHRAMLKSRPFARKLILTSRTHNLVIDWRRSYNLSSGNVKGFTEPQWILYSSFYSCPTILKTDQWIDLSGWMQQLSSYTIWLNWSLLSSFLNRQSFGNLWRKAGSLSESITRAAFYLSLGIPKVFHYSSHVKICLNSLFTINEQGLSTNC